MENLQYLGLAAFVLVGVRFLTSVRAGDLDSVLKTLIGWAAGIAAVLVYAHTGQADSIHVGNQALSALNGWDQVVLGVSVGSAAGAAWVGVKAFDANQSAEQSKLVGPKGG